MIAELGRRYLSLYAVYLTYKEASMEEKILFFFISWGGLRWNSKKLLLIIYNVIQVFIFEECLGKLIVFVVTLFKKRDDSRNALKKEDLEKCRRTFSRKRALIRMLYLTF
uniref:Uncharacterized protein n=1 Tax=Octopus bimaculoides TaxID=37653 RepID=A0A0L8GGP9_OCTBM